MVRFIAWIAVCVLLGAIVGYLAAPLGDAGWLLIAALIAAILAAPRLYVMYRLPSVLDRRIRPLVEPVVLASAGRRTGRVGSARSPSADGRDG